MNKGLIAVAVGLIIFFSYQHSHALCVNTSDANLRSGPGTNYEKTWEVFKYMPFSKLSEKDGWYRVKDVDGDIHWIYGKLVTEDFKCAVVKVDKANIRTGPGTGYSQKPQSPVMKYASFKIVTMDKEWVKVLDEYGDTGWIYKRLVWIN